MKDNGVTSSILIFCTFFFCIIFISRSFSFSCHFCRSGGESICHACTLLTQNKFNTSVLNSLEMLTIFVITFICFDCSFITAENWNSIAQCVALNCNRSKIIMVLWFSTVSTTSTMKSAVHTENRRFYTLFIHCLAVWLLFEKIHAVVKLICERPFSIMWQIVLGFKSELIQTDYYYYKYLNGICFTWSPYGYAVKRAC